MDLETLWYLVIGASILMYAILDGFDLGVGSLHLFAKNDEQRRVFLNAIGPVWDGNEVWIVVVMGGLFAGFPAVYASIFSGFYTLLMFLIAGLIFRASAIEFRSKRKGVFWRSLWDSVFSISSILVAFILGLLIGNLIEGINLDESQDYIGTFADFFRPYSIIVALTSLALFTMHGAIFLSMKSEGETKKTVERWIYVTIAVFLFWYGVLTFATLLYKPHMIVRFEEHPIFLIFPLLAFLSILSIPYHVRKGRDGTAFIFSCLSIAFLLTLFCIGTYPILVPSLIDPEIRNLTIYNTSSSYKTLSILLTVAGIGVPLVFAYGFWVYRVFRGKVKLDSLSY